MSDLTLQRLRKKKAAAMLPLVVLYLFLPGIILLFHFHYREEPEVFQRIVLQQLHVWIPLFSGWWILLLFHDFVDCEGNELLYLYPQAIGFFEIVLPVICIVQCGSHPVFCGISKICSRGIFCTAAAGRGNLCDQFPGIFSLLSAAEYRILFSDHSGLLLLCDPF